MLIKISVPRNEVWNWNLQAAENTPQSLERAIWFDA